MLNITVMGIKSMIGGENDQNMDRVARYFCGLFTQIRYKLTEMETPFYKKNPGLLIWELNDIHMGLLELNSRLSRPGKQSDMLMQINMPIVPGLCTRSDHRPSKAQLLLFAIAPNFGKEARTRPLHWSHDIGSSGSIILI